MGDEGVSDAGEFVENEDGTRTYLEQEEVDVEEDTMKPGISDTI